MDRTLEITKLNMFVSDFYPPDYSRDTCWCTNEIGTRYTSGHWNSLANLGSVWLVPSFFV